jgi:hypothetical protein
LIFSSRWISLISFRSSRCYPIEQFQHAQRTKNNFCTTGTGIHSKGVPQPEPSLTCKKIFEIDREFCNLKNIFEIECEYFKCEVPGGGGGAPFFPRSWICLSSLCFLMLRYIQFYFSCLLYFLHFDALWQCQKTGTLLKMKLQFF